MTALSRARAAAVAAVVLGLGAAGCFETPKPSCAFLCGNDQSCPGGYTCASDGWCKLDGVGDGFVCDGVAIDATPADAPVADAPVADAPADAPPEIDATEIDAEVDAPVDAAIDSSIDAAPAMLTIITASPLNFGAVIQTQAQAMTVTLRNTGGTVTSVVTLGLTGDPAYALVPGDTCSGNPLFPNTNCTFSVRFTPTAVGAATGVASAMAATGGTVSINLTGTGTPSLSALPMLNFGDVMTGMATTSTLTFSNQGTTTTGTLATVAPANPVFTITTDGCDGATVAATMSCQMTVRFAPTATGAQTSSVTVNGTPGGPRTVTLSGNGI